MQGYNPQIDNFNQKVIDRLISELQNQNESNDQRDGGSASFGYGDDV